MHFQSMRSIYLQSFMLISHILLELCPRQCSKCKDKQRAIIQVLGRQSYGICALHTYSMRSIFLQSFMLLPHIVLESCPGQSSKCKNKQRAIIQKLGKAELQFLCTAYLLNGSIYLQSFMLIPIVVSKLCSGQENRTDGRTYGRTDKAATICSPFEEHKN
jgi:hypothetical protein